jgi:hypothetical protein
MLISTVILLVFLHRFGNWNSCVCAVLLKKSYSLQNAAFWDIMPCAFVRTDVSEERISSIIRAKRISELGGALAITNILRNTDYMRKGTTENLKSYI